MTASHPPFSERNRAAADRRYEAKRVRAHTLLRQRHPDEWRQLMGPS